MLHVDRLAGAVVMAFALALWLYVIPDQVDTADYGWMRPRTLPSILAVALFVLGLVLALIRPIPAEDGGDGSAPDIALVIGLAGLGIFGMGHFGFLYAAPPLAIAAAWLLREHRWPLLIAAGILVPLAIWGLVEGILGRPLP